MPFFRDLRRRSKASFRTSDSSTDSKSTVPTAKSSSTLNSAPGSTTPPSTYHANGSASNVLAAVKTNGDTPPPVPQRPNVTLPNSNRNSMITLSPSGSNGTMRVPMPTSAFAPKITSILDNSVVHNKVLLIYGEIGDPSQKAIDGNLTVHHDKDGQSFPPTNWPVSDSYFKALVYLSPGWNKIRFDFTSPKLSSTSTGSAPTMHSSYIMLNYLPLNNAPPLQLVILAGKDSPCTYDAVPQRIQNEGNDLQMAIRKFRMAAHLWQAFTAEQMYRQKFGRRCFRFEEEWQTGTLSMRDWETNRLKNETRVHVIRSDKTTAELRDLQYAQQYGPAEKKGDLYSIAAEAVKKYYNIRPGQKQYVACLLLDAHWDSEVGTIRGHAALGGTGDDLGLAIFGSQALQSYPSCIEEVVPAFTDCTPTDTRFVANDCNECGSSWEAANIGIGAHLHEVGHLFGCPHQENGVMLRDYVRLNRTFVISEAYSTRTKSQGLKVCRLEDECGWHRLDVLRFRHHPCFKLPGDEPLSQDDSIQYFPVGNGRIICSAATGISFVEIWIEGDDLCRHWIDFNNADPRLNSLPRQVTLVETDIRGRLPEDKRKAKLSLTIFCGGSRNEKIEDLDELLSKKYIVNLPPLRQAPKRDEGLTMNAYNNMLNIHKSFDSRLGFKSKKLGQSALEGSQPEELILDCANIQTKLLRSVRVYHGYALDGIEFRYEDGHSQLFGKRGGKPGGDEFFLDTRRGETILGFYVRAGFWIDGIEILTSTGRRSGVFGNPNGGSGHTLMAPRGYIIAGIAGSCGAWIDGFQIIITR
ncbi:hypothetical protein HRR83_008835 [Exophiala dermatitidis]|uniref:Jacalin-type lectin domain-containing protein n=2 Tax=Exophiala dermatitidis TaxID=5970 RepID=H6BXG1_EXODN|nr:uncharacterized protein HMPREF1120_03531 [Exophiala dermatitidis NIH/UT8656]KAJ4503683.1 hypothetical protein HRR73_008988 [Exophiala dermatitidis]EHY55392.1 hypothetical protein HMPREF1120_03531 [Exophiala dermatitidis NIH/UT8656]KAJ4506268.1 hypothetical protein HRR75_007123 [Exophiala dermatitidis]KAJ4508363.1 hypothetical protein HRR74_007762 [Exophiala dermatitidis]KAJ4533419.1 hypothetical protein HRR77_008581 [Exophiala dermatitidis]